MGAVGEFNPEARSLGFLNHRSGTGVLGNNIIEFDIIRFL